tara:strand:+ start:182 stop:1009 length:828 start_codon:yes stop_codon:yes gene_type:complete
MKISERINKLKLKKLNYYAFLLHFISAVVVAGILFGASEDVKFNTNLYGYKIDTISGDGKTLTFSYGQEGDPVVVNSSSALKSIIVLIFLITALFHLFYWRSKRYIDEVKTGKNRFRWIEYAITASMMIYIYCILSGVKDLYTTFLIVILNIVMMSFGYFLEMSRTPESKLTAIIMGFFILTVIFSIAYYQFVMNIDAAKATFDIPDWVYAIVIAMVFWWVTFGVIAVLYYKAYLNGTLDFTRYEKYYVFLSFVSKAFMGYYITFGLTRDSPKEN